MELSAKYGAEFCINAAREDAVKRVKGITERGSDVVVEAAGKTRAVEQSPHKVRKGGQVALVGEFKGRMNFKDADEACFSFYYVYFASGVSVGGSAHR